jgi:pre-mRNA-processing factor SLU7
VEKQTKSSVMERYGNAAKQPDGDEARLLMGQTEGYVEYNAAGRLIKGEEAKVRSYTPLQTSHPGSM